MGDMGLGPGYGAGGAADAITQILQRRIIEKQNEEKQRAAMADEAIRQQQVNQQGSRDELQVKLRQDGLTETARRNDMQDKEREAVLAGTLANSLPAGPMSANDPAAATGRDDRHDARPVR